MVSSADAKVCLLTGPLDDRIQSAEIYRPLLIELRHNRVKMICANPDLVVKSGSRLVICAGSIAQLYEQLGGQVTYAGKPNAPIYQLAMQQMNIAAGRILSKSRVLVGGDGLPSDIKGAAGNGFDACFIAGGIHSAELGDMTVIQNVIRADQMIKHQFSGLQLVGICDRLRWG